MPTRYLFFDRTRAILLFLGVFVITISSLLISTAANTTTLRANQDLQDLWRTSYDILVRPAGARSELESRLGLVPANYLSGIWGGISMEQFNAIRAIPGVEVAAPIAVIGYFSGGYGGDAIEFPADTGLYFIDRVVHVTDGVNQYQIQEGYDVPYYFFTRNPQEPPPIEQSDYVQSGGLNINVLSTYVTGRADIPFLVAGVLPSEEQKLLGLDLAITQGNFLADDQSLEHRFTPVEGATQLFAAPINFPVLLNSRQYIDFSLESSLYKVTLPEGIHSAQQIVDMGGTAFIDGLPRQLVEQTTTDGADVYQNLLEEIAPHFFGITTLYGSPEMILGTSALAGSPGPIVYAEAAAPAGYEGTALQVIMPAYQPDEGIPNYREDLGKPELSRVAFWEPIGLLDIERIPAPADPSRVPLETYHPPLGLLRFDLDGNPVIPPVAVNPTLNPYGYIQNPPLMLTTLEAATAVWGEAAISAIRIRVEGVDQLDRNSQQKIEQIATEIAEQTGLEVDIMVGSSPTRVLVYVPEVGYVEEQWIQKGVSLEYQSGIQSGNLMLLAAIAIASFIFVFDLAWSQMHSSRDLVLLNISFGWRPKALVLGVVKEVAKISLAASLLGLTAAFLLANIFDLGFRTTAFILLPAIFGLSVLGAYLPAALVSKSSFDKPVGMNGQIQRNFKREHINVWLYAWKQLARRSERTLLASTISLFSTALLVVLLTVVWGQQGMLSGTLLGEFILARVKQFHYIFVITGFVLSAMATANGLLASIFLRKREIAVLKAAGWRTRFIVLIFVLEGVLLGVLGGLPGAILGGLVIYGMYGTLVTSSLAAILVGFLAPIAVNALAAIVPSLLAARIPPAEAMSS